VNTYRKQKKNEKHLYVSKVVFASILSLTIFACSDEEATLENQDGSANIELLKTDTRFSDLIKSSISLMNNTIII